MGYNPQGRRELDKTERLTHTQLIYNVVLVSDAQQSESAMHIHTLEAAPPILWPPNAKRPFIGKDPASGKG